MPNLLSHHRLFLSLLVRSSSALHPPSSALHLICITSASPGHLCISQTRLAQYYEYLTLEERRALEAEIVRKCLARNEQQVPSDLKSALILQKKARLQAEAKAAEEARGKKEAEAVAEAKRKRGLEREAARQALLQIEKTVEINDPGTKNVSPTQVHLSLRKVATSRVVW